MKTKKVLAKVVVNYYEGYKKYLKFYNLDDDSKVVTIKDLINFIEDTMGEEDLKQFRIVNANYLKLQ